MSCDRNNLCEDSFVRFIFLPRSLEEAIMRNEMYKKKQNDARRKKGGWAYLGGDYLLWSLSFIDSH